MVERRQWSHDLVRVDQTTIGTPYTITETQINQASNTQSINQKSSYKIQIKKSNTNQENPSLTLETMIDYSLVIDLSKDTNKEIKRGLIELDRRSGVEKS